MLYYSALSAFLPPRDLSTLESGLYTIIQIIASTIPFTAVKGTLNTSRQLNKLFDVGFVAIDPSISWYAAIIATKGKW